MATFDYNRYTAVGIVDNLPANSNSFLHVIGYCEKYSNKIIHYTPEQARAIFTKKGRVFVTVLLISIQNSMDIVLP